MTRLLLASAAALGMMSCAAMAQTMSTTHVELNHHQKVRRYERNANRFYPDNLPKQQRRGVR
jgi:hypothetical protein